MNQPIRFRHIINQPILIQIGFILGKTLTRKNGLSFADWIGTRLGKANRLAMVKAIRANQWVIHDDVLTEEELVAFPEIVFRSAARCMFDFFYYLTRAEELQSVVDFSPKALHVMGRIQNNQPCVVVCPHLSNFELMGYVLALHNVDVQVLSYPNPNLSYKQQNKLRENLGMHVTPMSIQAFRQARVRLRKGGSILTGLDRPLSGEHLEKYIPTFFGHKANLPVVHVRMAKEANAPVFVLAATSQPGGRYQLESSDPIWMKSDDDLEIEILANANRVLIEAEPLIKKYSDQWAMFYPVWPQYLGI